MAKGKILFFYIGLLFLLFPSVSWAVPIIVNIEIREYYIGRTYIFEDCEWLDYFQHFEDITYREYLFAQVVENHIDYKDLQSNFNIRDDLLLDPPILEIGEYREWTEYTLRIFTEYANFCDDYCGGHEITTPEPSIFYMTIIGLVMIFINKVRALNGKKENHSGN